MTIPSGPVQSIVAQAASDRFSFEWIHAMYQVQFLTKSSNFIILPLAAWLPDAGYAATPNLAKKLTHLVLVFACRLETRGTLECELLRVKQSGDLESCFPGPADWVRPAKAAYLFLLPFR